MRKKAIFLDKDGTLITDIPYNTDPEKIQLEKNVAEGLQLLRKKFEFIVITNQPGVALGIINEDDLDKVKGKIEMLLKPYSVKLSGFYYCPHSDDPAVTKVKCSCRKPLPGLILKAAEEKNIDLKESWVIGDIINDVEAGNRAGCKSILVDNGNETDWKSGEYRTPAYLASDMEDAARYILSVTK